MDLMEAVRARHSVRNYTDRPIEGEVLKALEEEIAACNREAGLHIQLVRDEPRAFDSTLAHYGSFTGVRNYLAMIGPKDGDLMEKCGYYGERIVLKAQMLGLNTCWVALTFKKIPDAYVVGPGEKLGIVIAIGYGEHEGKPRKSKTAEAVSNMTEDSPEWFRNGVEAALLAPTAVNQQKFSLQRSRDTVSLKKGLGPYAGCDLGIIRYHFEIGAGTENFRWK